MANLGRDATGRSHRILGDLAASLGCSVDVFYDATRNDDVAMTEELLHLWFSIEDAGARRRILECARAAAAAEPQAQA